MNLAVNLFGLELRVLLQGIQLQGVLQGFTAKPWILHHMAGARNPPAKQKDIRAAPHTFHCDGGGMPGGRMPGCHPGGGPP